MIIDESILTRFAEWMKSREDIPKDWIYLGDDTERYLLGESGSYMMLVFGANPSTACPGERNLDPTIRKVRKLVAEAGYDGWVMANLYPLRATDPADLPEEANEELLKNNNKVLKALEKAYPIHAAWAA